MSFLVSVKMAFVIDFQAFKSLSNEFVLKELAIVGVRKNIIHHFFIKPPSSVVGRELGKRVQYITRHIHNIPWNYGHIELEEALHILNDILKDASVVYVKGSERAKFLKKCIFWDVKIIDLDHLGCPNADFLPSALLQVCMFRGHFKTNYRCALKNAQKYKQWIV